MDVIISFSALLCRCADCSESLCSYNRLRCILLYKVVLLRVENNTRIRVGPRTLEYGGGGGMERGRHDVSGIRCKGGEYERGLGN